MRQGDNETVRQGDGETMRLSAGETGAAFTSCSGAMLALGAVGAMQAFFSVGHAGTDALTLGDDHACE
jgi:hypothetical protein